MNFITSLLKNIIKFVIYLLCLTKKINHNYFI